MIKCIRRLFYKTKKIGQIPKEIIARYLPENPVILEAGAHVGTDTIEMLKVWPNAKIYAFEPVPVLFSALVNNTRVSNNILCFQLALSDNVGKGSLFVSSGSSDGSSSLLTPKEHLNNHPSVKFEEQLIIETTTIDEWASKNNLHSIDFLWLDLQGMELKVLKASPNILRAVQAIYMEVSFIENYDCGELYPEVKKWLESNGFSVERKEFAWDDAGNVLFVKKSKNDSMRVIL